MKTDTSTEAKEFHLQPEMDSVNYQTKMEMKFMLAIGRTICTRDKEDSRIYKKKK